MPIPIENNVQKIPLQPFFGNDTICMWNGFLRNKGIFDVVDVAKCAKTDLINHKRVDLGKFEYKK